MTVFPNILAKQELINPELLEGSRAEHEAEIRGYEDLKKRVKKQTGNVNRTSKNGQ